MECPTCGVDNPPEAIICECGYDLEIDEKNEVRPNPKQFVIKRMFGSSGKKPTEELGEEANLPLEKYYNQSDCYSISLPTSWERKEDFMESSVIALEALKGKGDKFRENINVSIHKFETAISLDGWLGEYINSAHQESQLKKLVTHEQGDYILNGQPSKFVIFSYSMNWQRIKAIVFLANRDEMYYEITCTAVPKTFQQYNTIFKKIVNTFKAEGEEDNEELSLDQLKKMQELIGKNIERIEKEKQGIIDEGAKKGMVVQTETMLESFDELKASYDGNYPEAYSAVIDKNKQFIRDKYGTTIPVDILYKIADGTETFDSLMDSEVTSEQLTADTIALDIIFDKILKSSVEAKSPEDGVKYIDNLKQKFSMMYGNFLTVEQAVYIVNMVTKDALGGELENLVKRLLKQINVLESEEIKAFNALSKDEMLSSKRIERVTMTIDHLIEVMDINFDADDPERLCNEMKQSLRDTYGDTVTSGQARIIGDSMKNVG